MKIDEKSDPTQSDTVKRALALIRGSGKPSVAQPDPQTPQALEIRETKTIQAVKICSHILEDTIWLILDRSFIPHDGLAVYYPEEIPLLNSKTPEQLREIHKYKLAFPGARVIQEGAEERVKKIMEEKKKQAPSFKLETTKQSKSMGTTYYDVETWNKLSASERGAIIDEGFENKKATMNEQNSASIEWAHYSLNSVTGCLHGCPYCYARDIANKWFKYGFTPVFHPARLAAPGNTHIPSDSNPAFHNIFANSMSDLFGKWVPNEWIEATIEMASVVSNK